MRKRNLVSPVSSLCEHLEQRTSPSILFDFTMLADAILADDTVEHSPTDQLAFDAQFDDHTLMATPTFSVEEFDTDFDFRHLGAYAENLQLDIPASLDANVSFVVPSIGSDFYKDDKPDDSNSGDTENGGTSIGTGSIEIRDDSIVFVTDKTATLDAWFLSWVVPAGTPIHEDISNWRELQLKIIDEPDDSFNDIVLSGHGSRNGGVQASDGSMEAGNLPDDVAQTIDDKLKDDGRLVILGCRQGSASRTPGMEQLAEDIGHPVIGNTDPVWSNVGDGEWMQFDPPDSYAQDDETAQIVTTTTVLVA